MENTTLFITDAVRLAISSSASMLSQIANTSFSVGKINCIVTPVT